MMSVCASGVKIIGRVVIPVIGIRRDMGALPRAAGAAKVAKRVPIPAMTAAA